MVLLAAFSSNTMSSCIMSALVARHSRRLDSLGPATSNEANPNGS